VRNVLSILAVTAALIAGTNLASAQVKTEQSGKGVSSEPSDKGEIGKTEPKQAATPSASEPNSGVQLKGQPELQQSNKPTYGYK
jgi:hypothetical protein